VRRGLTTVLLLLGISPAATASPADLPRRVIILSGTDVMLPASLVEDAILRTELSKIDGRPIEFFSEGLDAFRFESEEYEAELVAFFQRKYREHRPDVIVAISELAVAFLMRHRERLWTDSPVIFSSVPRGYFSESSPAPPWAVGVFEDHDVAGTIALAESLQPGVRRIVVVAGQSAWDARLTADVVRKLRIARPDLPLDLRVGVPISRFRAEFGALPEHSIIFYTAMFRDSEGRMTVPRVALRSLASAAAVPVYGLYSTFLDTGLVGGALYDFEAEGRAAAALARRVLLGERPADIRVAAPSPIRIVVDARQLARFGIPERRVPTGAELRFRTPTLWELHRWRIVAVAAALVLETALIIALLWQRRARHRAEKESRQRRRELAHATRLTTVGELTASISHEINQPLGAILANAEVAEVLLETDPSQIEEVRQILADIRRDDLRASEVIRGVRRLVTDRDVEMKPLDVNAVVESAVRMLDHEAQRRGVTVDRRLEQGLPMSRGDDVSLQQVVINLALNAMEAMAETPAGRRRLVVRTGLSNGHVAVGISDRGRGIGDLERPRIFESFFTTKEQGLGLGLSICRTIVEAHGGTIGARNNPEGGATFEFALPARRGGHPAGTGARGPARTAS
jgi:signal transduction histidine kinase